jgi:hypothetical protein
VKVTAEFCAMVDADVTSLVEVLTTAELTLTVTALEVDCLNPVVPEYSAVIESDPTGSVEMVTEALPALSEEVSIAAEPS